MTALNRNPTNIDLLQSTKFRVTFSRLPGLTYFCTSANLPGISLTEIPRATPFVELYHPGEKVVYDTFNVTFLVDEDLLGWLEIHDWIRGITFPTEYEEYLTLQKISGAPLLNRASSGFQYAYTDAFLTIFTNKNNPNVRIKFYDVFPTSIGSLIFNTGDSSENIVVADATFRFSYYNYEKI